MICYFEVCVEGFKVVAFVGGKFGWMSMFLADAALCFDFFAHFGPSSALYLPVMFMLTSH